MQTIDLECPSCKTMLELDAGFAGGVCRCSSCGTLMTVPADPRRERAESLSRPDRPDAPASSGASGTWQSQKSSSSAKLAAPSPPPSPRPSSPAAPAPGATTPPAKSPAGKPAAPAPVGPGASTGKAPAPSLADTQTFVTASGKVIKVTNRGAIPVARKKREVVRFSVYLVFMLIFGAVAAAVVVAVMVLTSSKSPDGNQPQQRPRDGTRDVVGYDSSVNPFMMPKANCLGVMLEGRAIVIVDAAPLTSQWRALALDAVALGVRTPTPKVEFQLLLATEQKVQSFPDKPKPLGSAEAAAVRAFIDSAQPAGAGSVLAALRGAIEAKASQIVLVSGRSFDSGDVAQIKELIEPITTTRLDLVMIDADPPAALQTLSQARGGRSFSVPRSVLVRWFQEYEAKQGESAATQP